MEHLNLHSNIDVWLSLRVTDAKQLNAHNLTTNAFKYFCEFKIDDSDHLMEGFRHEIERKGIKLQVLIENLEKHTTYRRGRSTYESKHSRKVVGKYLSYKEVSFYLL
jgi:hypothetical protein